MGALSRASIARALESKLRAEVAAARGRRGSRADLPPGPWRDDLRLGEDGTGSDSLERLWLASAAGSMFHLDALGGEGAGALLAAPTFGEWVDLAGAALARAGRITFSTSGSTGAPKRCLHTLEDLSLEVEALAGLLPGRRRVVATVPAHHIYGFLFTCMLPERLGAAVLDAPRGIASGALAPGDLVVSHPEMWRALEEAWPVTPPDVVGVTSTAPCPRPLIEALAAKGVAGVAEVYGSSETAGIGVRMWPHDEYQLLPMWHAEESADGPLLRHVGGREVIPMDALAFPSPRRFAVLGRRDGVVQVGGENVFPARVTAQLEDHPLVARACVRLMRPTEGWRLKAFVVPVDGALNAEVEAALRTYARDALRPAERPAAYEFGTDLPRGAMGKLADW